MLSEYHDHKIVTMIDPITGSTTAHFSSPSAGLDLAGFNSALIDIATGIAGAALDGSNKVAFKLQESDSASSGYTDVVTAANIIGQTPNASTGVFKTLDGTDMLASSRTKLAYVGKKRYIKVVGTVTGTVSNPVSVTAVLGHARNTTNVNGFTAGDGG